MTSDEEKKMTEVLQQCHDMAAKAGLVAKFAGFGVLVLCLPKYGEAEQLLLETTQKTLPADR